MQLRTCATVGVFVLACVLILPHDAAAFIQKLFPLQEFIDDSHDPAATKVAVAAIIAGRSADEWRPLFAAADCCVTIMATLEEAMHDPHFVARGLFAHQVAGPTGATMPALPVPIDPRFRADPRDVKAVPKLSE